MELKCRLFSLLSIALLVTGRAYSQKRFTVEAIHGTETFRAKSLKGVQWVPNEHAFTYVEDDRNGLAAVWKYENGSGKRVLFLDPAKIRVLQAERREKRFVIPNYAWSPDGKSILIPSGGDLHLVHTGSQTLTRLTRDTLEERDPQFSPDGKRLAYLKRWNLAVLDCTSGREIAVTNQGNRVRLVGRFDWVYEEEFSIRSGFAWSPDSRRIAYFELDTSREPQFPLVDFVPFHNTVEFLRYPKAGDPNAGVRIGVAPTDGGETVWMDTGRDPDAYLPRIHWLKDGDRLAIQRLNRKQNRLDVLVADARTGRSECVLTETDPDGWVDVNEGLTFLEDRRHFLWVSERTNWNHLYLYRTDGRLVRPLTSGNWNVEQLLGVDSTNGRVYFTASEKSPLETHVYCVDLDGRGFRRLSAEEGTHVPNLSPDRRFYLDTHSGIARPGRTVLCRTDGSTVGVVESGDIPALDGYRLARADFLTIRTDDGLDLNAFLIKPTDFDPTRKYPVLVYTYGGPGSQIVRNDWRGGPGMGRLWHQLMLQKGYLVFGLDNRGTGNNGNAFMNLLYRDMGRAVEDQIRGAEYLRRLPYVDGNRIGIWGWSGGGWMVCMAMTRGAGYFKAGAAVAPVCDFRNYDTIWTERYLDLPQDNPKGYDASSPIRFIDRYRGGLFLIHGVNDDNVHVANTMQMVQALQNAKKPFQLMVYPGKDHGISGKNTQVHLYEAMTDFFLKNL